MNLRVLVVDDEPQIQRALRIGLERNGCEVVLASNGEEALDAVAATELDLIILDLAMPGIGGLEVCRQVREWGKIPIIVLSVRDFEGDKIAALDLGADDYLTKPFSLEELLARMRALLRRARQDERPASAIFRAGDLEVDFVKRRVQVAGKPVHLTPIEYDLLSFLVKHPDRVLTHRHLLSTVWGPEFAEETHTLRVHISNLRDKIEPDAARPRYLQTEPRVGYRFRES